MYDVSLDPKVARTRIKLLAVLLGGVAMAQNGRFVLERPARVISLEPYAANIVRVTMSIDRAAATDAPGYGIVAKPSWDGWTHDRDAAGYDGTWL